MVDLNIRKWKQLCYVQSFFGLETFTAPILVLFYTRYAGFTFADYSSLMSLICIFLWIFEIPTGAFADRFGRKLSLIVGNCIYLSAMICLLCFKNEISVFLLAFLFALGGSLGSGPFYSLMYQAFAAYGQQATYHTIVARGTSVALFGAAIAAAVGGALAEYALSLPMLVDIAILALVTLFLLWRLPGIVPLFDSGDGKKLLTERFSQILKSGLNEVVSSKTMMIIIFLSAIIFACLRSGFNLYQPMLSNNGVPAYEIGLLFAAFLMFSSGVAYLFSYASKKLIMSKSPVLFSACLIIISAVFAYLPGVLWIAIAILCHQIVRGVSPSYFSLLLNREITHTSQSRTTVLSVASLISAIFSALFMYVIGAVAEGIGFSQAFTWLSIASALLLIVGFVFLKVESGELPASISSVRD